MSWSHVCGTLRSQPWPKGTRSTGAEKVIRVLWYYAELADETSGEAYPSQMTIAEELGLYVRDVQNAQKALVEQGFLKKVREPKLGERGTTYRLAAKLQSSYHEALQPEYSAGSDPGRDEPEVIDSEFLVFLSDSSRHEAYSPAAGDPVQSDQSIPVDAHGDVHGAACGETHGVTRGQNHGILHGYVPGTTEIQNNRRTEKSADPARSPKLPWWPALKAVRQLVNSLPERTFYELQQSPQQMVDLMHAEVLERCSASASDENLQVAARIALQGLFTAASSTDSGTQAC